MSLIVIKTLERVSKKLLLYNTRRYIWFFVKPFHNDKMIKNDIISLKFLPDDGATTFEKINEKPEFSLYKNESNLYMILEREYSYKLNLSCFDNIDWTIKAISMPNIKFNNFIVDMNGIDNFITSKSLIFKDSTLRKLILQHLNLFNKSYFRFGASGSHPSRSHPGGEVVEIQDLDFLTNQGVSNSISGCVNLPENEFSIALPLSEDGITMRDERAVYSHTAWIEKEANNIPIVIEVSPQNNTQSLLTLVYDFCKSFNLDATGVAIQLNGSKGIKVKGRVLKHIPEKAFNVLQEATDIAIENEFYLPNGSHMYLFGTLYKRYEPEWKEFTGGRQYEKRGHFHSFILGNDLKNIHEVFHVREIHLDENISVTLEIYPVTKIYRIYPVNYKNDKYYISSSNKEIEEFAINFNDANKKL